MKPENIVIGQGKKAGTVYLIDFGLAKRFLCPKTGRHIPYKEDKGIIGTARYLSLRGHQGNEHSRRDDMESLGIVLINFLSRGALPWDVPKPIELKIEAVKDNFLANEQAMEALNAWNAECCNVKVNTSVEQLCEHVPI